MNDVLNSQAYTQAGWWNRIPVAAWSLMGLIAISCNLLIGYAERRTRVVLLLVLPVIVSNSCSLPRALPSLEVEFSGRRTRSGSLAKFTASRRASSLVRSLAAARLPGSS